VWTCAGGWRRVRVTAWDYMYKSEFKARAELSAESELVLEDGGAASDRSDERCEDRPKHL